MGKISVDGILIFQKSGFSCRFLMCYFLITIKQHISKLTPFPTMSETQQMSFIDIQCHDLLEELIQRLI